MVALHLNSLSSALTELVVNNVSAAALVEAARQLESESVTPKARAGRIRGLLSRFPWMLLKPLSRKNQCLN